MPAAATPPTLKGARRPSGKSFRTKDFFSGLLDIEISAQDTSLCPLGSVVMDFVRRDTEPDLYLGFTLEIPVVRPRDAGALRCSAR